MLTGVHYSDKSNTSRKQRRMKNISKSHRARPDRTVLGQPSSNHPIASLRSKGRVLTGLLAIAACLAAPVGHALTETELAAIRKIISDAPAAELPLKSAEIVAKARQSEKVATAVAVVRAAIAKRPASAVSVVGSTVKAAPFTAPAVAAAAAKLAPDQAADIGVAAALQAPELAEEESAAIVQVIPESAERVARAIHSAVPKTGRPGVKSGRPETDPFGAENPDSETRLEPNNPDNRDNSDSPFAARLNDYGSPGHNKLHPRHPVHPPHPPRDE
jgi:hypothetical protein